MSQFPNRFDIVGSFLRPAAIKQAHADLKAGKISQNDATAIENQQVERLVKKEIDLGLTDVTDGEFHRSWWHLDFLAGLNGADFFEPEHGFVFNGQETRKGAIRIDGKITYNPDHPFFKGFQFLQSIVPAGITPKQTIPSPSVLFPNEAAMIYDNYYHDFDAFLADEIKLTKRPYNTFTTLAAAICNWTTPHGACGPASQRVRRFCLNWHRCVKQRSRPSTRLRITNLMT